MGQGSGGKSSIQKLRHLNRGFMKRIEIEPSKRILSAWPHQRACYYTLRSYGHHPRATTWTDLNRGMSTANVRIQTHFRKLSSRIYPGSRFNIQHNSKLITRRISILSRGRTTDLVFFVYRVHRVLWARCVLTRQRSLRLLTRRKMIFTIYIHVWGILSVTKSFCNWLLAVWAWSACQGSGGCRRAQDTHESFCFISARWC